MYEFCMFDINLTYSGIESHMARTSTFVLLIGLRLVKSLKLNILMLGINVSE